MVGKVRVKIFDGNFSSLKNNKNSKVVDIIFLEHHPSLHLTKLICYFGKIDTHMQ